MPVAAENSNDLPRQLCFDTNDFLDSSFSIDSFLRDHRHRATLEVLRDDLGSYLKILRLSMIDLINKDYEDFVNLSKDLVGLNYAIEALEDPLLRVKSEVMAVKSSLEDTISGLLDCLKQDAAIKERKQCLTHLSQVITSSAKLKKMFEKETNSRDSTMETLERALGEYTILTFSLDRCQSLVSHELRKDTNWIDQTLVTLVNNTFLECICDKDMEQMARCIRLFLGMGKVTAMERLVTEELVEPFLRSAVRDAARLKDTLEATIAFVDSQLMPLVTLSAEHAGKVNFIARGLWPEMERRLELDMPAIFSAGEPDAFRARYADCVAFLAALADRCGSSVEADLLMSHPNTLRFKHKWNLLVYFKIRFQEIAAELECALESPAETPSSNPLFRLEASAVAALCLNRCWAPGVFLPDVSHLFWKLSLQIISRFCVWLKEEALKDRKSDETHSKAGSELAVNAFLDAVALDKLSQELLSSQPNAERFRAALGDSSAQLEDGRRAVSRALVDHLVRGSLSPLSQVKDIPRLFRRTNRDMPDKPSDYVNSLLQLPTEFFSKYEPLVPAPLIQGWMSSALSEISVQLYTQVHQVLTNAQKTEESLRRLKKAKGTIESTEPPMGTDDDKIKQQLFMDVQRFCEGAQSLKLSVEDVSKLPELVELVTNARRKPDAPS